MDYAKLWAGNGQSTSTPGHAECARPGMQPTLSETMKPISIDNVIHTYRFYAPLYDRLFGAVFEPGRRALSQAVNALRSILARFCRISCGFHRLRAEIAFSAF